MNMIRKSILAALLLAAACPALPAEAGPRAGTYPWERRAGRPTASDAVLCYGNSHHRNPYLWDERRFEPYVTYVDEQGREQWLFDGFIFLESQDMDRPDKRNYTYMTGVLRDQGLAAGKEQWQELIDYFFAEGNCIDALDKSVAEAERRIGRAPTRRRVVVMLPDPVIHRMYADTTATTVYWGELDGRKLDFSRNEDRIAACKWYIDSVRRLFDKADYRYVELAGFYIVSEDLATPGDGWNPELKRWEEVIPEVAEYLHALNESLCWIPYNRAAGYRNWKRFGIDYAYMQPNYFWDNKGEKPLSRFFSDIKANDLAMEFEFDDALLEKTAGSEVYRRRLREYMDGAKEHGIYGRKPLAYYHGQNTLYELSVSAAAEDRKLYHEFCRFVLDNPLRK